MAAASFHVEGLGEKIPVADGAGVGMGEEQHNKRQADSQVANGSLARSSQSQGSKMVALVLLPFDGKAARQQHERLASLLSRPRWGE